MCSAGGWSILHFENLFWNQWYIIQVKCVTNFAVVYYLPISIAPFIQMVSINFSQNEELGTELRGLDTTVVWGILLDHGHLLNYDNFPFNISHWRHISSSKWLKLTIPNKIISLFPILAIFLFFQYFKFYHSSNNRFLFDTFKICTSIFTKKFTHFQMAQNKLKL